MGTLILRLGAAESPAFWEWFGVSLTSENRRMVYVPERCAHGFLTLEDETEVVLQMSRFYHPDLARGVRWNDPAFQIEWPDEARIPFPAIRDAADLLLRSGLLAAAGPVEPRRAPSSPSSEDVV